MRLQTFAVVKKLQEMGGSFSLTLHKTTAILLSESAAEARAPKQKMLFDTHKSFSQKDTLQLIMFSRLVCATNVIHPDKDQKLAQVSNTKEEFPQHNKFRENMLIQTPTGGDPLEKTKNRVRL